MTNTIFTCGWCSETITVQGDWISKYGKMCQLCVTAKNRNVYNEEIIKEYSLYELYDMATVVDLVRKCRGLATPTKEEVQYLFTRSDNTKKQKKEIKETATQIKKLKSQVSRTKKELPHVEAEIRRLQALLTRLESSMYSDAYRRMVKYFLRLERSTAEKNRSSW